MAAPEAALEGDFRTEEGEPRSLPPSDRKFAFKSLAADSAGNSAGGVERLSEAGGEAGGPQRETPGASSQQLLPMAAVVKAACGVHKPSVRGGGQPADTKTRVASKSLLPVMVKEVDIPRHPDSENDITEVTKPRGENGLVKAAETSIRKNIKKGYKAVSKQKSVEELKDKNQLLEAVNKQLHQKLTETQAELKDLTQKVELLEKFQGNCLALLESKGLNPGSETLVSQQESTTDHTDSMLLLETLQDELQIFNETAKKQMEELQALKIKLKLQEEKRVQFLEQQTLCNDHLNDFSLVLKEMEQLLEM